jgi:hypothetical protein
MRRIYSNRSGTPSNQIMGDVGTALSSVGGALSGAVLGSYFGDTLATMGAIAGGGVGALGAYYLNKALARDEAFKAIEANRNKTAGFSPTELALTGSVPLLAVPLRRASNNLYYNAYNNYLVEHANSDELQKTPGLDQN